MKRLVILLVGIITALHANNQETFLRANQLYKAGEYASALSQYESMKKPGSAVWINMGNCLYYLERYPQALVAYKKALKDASRAQYGISIDSQKKVLQKLGKEVHVSWWHALVVWMRTARAGISLLVLQLFFLLLWFIFIYFIYRIRNGIWYRVISVFLSVLVLLSAVVLYDAYTMRSQNIAIVLSKDNLSVFSGPDERYHVLGSLAYAQEVVIEEAADGWYKVRYGSKVGWVPAYVLLCV